jgi:MoxR-like ATPase
VTTEENPADLQALAAAAARVARAVDQSVIGQSVAAGTLLAAYVAGGHALIEGVPGIAKTLLVRCFASSLGLDFARIQFTPDMMPADVTGTNVFDLKSGAFRLVRGPVFTEVLMADEINRTTPKTQSALLEAMQESQVTIDGVSHLLPPSFFAVATQNPVEFEGTYPLPEAQLDRFLVRVDMGMPDRAAELEIFRRAVSGELVGWAARAALPPPAISREDAVRLRRASSLVHMAPELLEYLARLAAAVRESPRVEIGISPRGALALLEASRSAALLAGRAFVVPDDVKRFLLPCWGHRLRLTAESELEGHSPRKVLEEAAAAVAVPR